MDELYLDFIAVLADGKSINPNRTAYVEILRDDNVPYILIGDGAEDGKWDLTFYVDATGDNPETRDPEIPNTPASNDNTPNTNPNTNNESKSSGSSGGGGCNS